MMQKIYKTAFLCAMFFLAAQPSLIVRAATQTKAKSKAKSSKSAVKKTKVQAKLPKAQLSTPQTVIPPTKPKAAPAPLPAQPAASASDTPATPAPAKPSRNHSGFVAFFGPLYFSETFQFVDSLNAANKDTVQSKSIGMNAGFSIEHQLNWLSLNFDFGIIGAYNSVSTPSPVYNDYTSTGMILGVSAKPYLLLRWRGIEIGPELPVMYRYASYAVESSGKLDTKNFQPLVGYGVLVKYDFGNFRVGADFAYLPSKNPLTSLQLQFEL